MTTLSEIQPLGRDTDYFAVFGIPRRLQIDPEALEQGYHALSRRFHPDMYRLASPRERMIALENSRARFAHALDVASDDFCALPADHPVRRATEGAPTRGARAASG